MSPKSITPISRPSSTSRLVRVTSAWITWARRPGRTGATRASNRPSTRSTWARRAAVGEVVRAAGGARARVRDVPQDLVVGREGGKTPAAPAPARAVVCPKDQIARVVSADVRGHLPGQEREQPHRVVPAVGPAHLGPGLPHRVRQHPHHRQARIHPLDVAERGGLHLHGGQARPAGLEILNRKPPPAGARPPGGSGPVLPPPPTWCRAARRGHGPGQPGRPCWLNWTSRSWSRRRRCCDYC